jgi:hypothetical protein
MVYAASSRDGALMLLDELVVTSFPAAVRRGDSSSGLAVIRPVDEMDDPRSGGTATSPSWVCMREVMAHRGVRSPDDRGRRRVLGGWGWGSAYVTALSVMGTARMCKLELTLRKLELMNYYIVILILIYYYSLILHTMVHWCARVVRGWSVGFSRFNVIN